MDAPHDFGTPRLDPGEIRVTPAALKALRRSRHHPGEFLGRHLAGDYGDVSDKDRWLNDRARFLAAGVLSSYKTRHGEELFVVTEADWSVTTVMLREEY
jgi:hypothetical protein